MTNLECAISVLAKHREARMWADEAVAADMMAQLGLDPAADVSVPSTDDAQVSGRSRGRKEASSTDV